MTLRDMREKWALRRQEGADFNARVDLTTVCEAVLQDIDTLLAHQESEVLTLREAAGLSGYSSEHLGRLTRNGKIPNAGRPGSPGIRRADLPIKPGHLPNDEAGLQIHRASKEHVVRSFVTNSRRRGSAK